MNAQPVICEKHCESSTKPSGTRLIVITGGPGAGKTAVLEMAKKVLCERVAILPEAASIVFGGGFWRLQSNTAKLAAQSAIFHIQVEMENLVIRENRWDVGLCDRGTLDGLAYWNEDPKLFWEMSRSQITKEYDRYKAVIHLRSPPADLGYNKQNPLRIESAQQAAHIDEKIHTVWSQHPNYKMIENAQDFITKANFALNAIATVLPDCCRDVVKGASGQKMF